MIFLSFILSLIALSIDQFSKFLARESLFNTSQPMEIFNFLNLTPSWNKGISFGFLNNDAWYTTSLLIILSIVLIGVLVYWILQRKGYLLNIALGLILGGALGNLMDRFIFGAVFDFIDVHFKGYHFWTFNGADSFITIGAVLFLLDILIDSRSKTKKDISQ